LQGIISNIENRLAKLELGKRFTFPNVSSDPANPRKGDAWLNVTSNTPKYVDATGAVSTFGGGGGGSPATTYFGPRYILSGYYYSPYFYNENYNNINGIPDQINLTINTMYAMPFMIPSNTTATSILIRGLKGGVPNPSVRLGIYSNSSAGQDYPDARLLDAGVVSVTNAVTWTNYSITIGQALTANTLYWLVMVNQTASSFYYNLGASKENKSPFMPQITLANINSSFDYGSQQTVLAWTQTGVTGALPANFTATKTESYAAPLIWLGF